MVLQYDAELYQPHNCEQLLCSPCDLKSCLQRLQYRSLIPEELLHLQEADLKVNQELRMEKFYQNYQTVPLRFNAVNA